MTKVDALQFFRCLAGTLALVVSGCGGSGTPGAGSTDGGTTHTGTPDGPQVAGNGLIAFPWQDDQGRQQLFTITIDGTNRTQLTFEDDNSMPSWSPDGSRLVYVRRTPSPQLNIMDADGGNKRTLVTGDSPDWGPNGQIAYAFSDPAEIWVVDAEGGTPRQVTSGGDHGGRVHPSWSPDGRRLVYMQLTPQDPATDDTANGCPALPVRAELWIIDADGSNGRVLTTATGFSNVDTGGQLMNSAFDANAPDWSAAEDHIVFWSGQEQCYGQVWRIDADGSARMQLSKAPIPSHNDDPAWSPDGTKVIFTTDRGGRPEVWVMDADGGNPRFVTQNRPGPGPGDAAWQPILR
jgi:Tol biopolymer transport system component